MQRDPEIFVPVIDFPELYHISNHGRVKALAKWVDIGLGRRQFHPEKIMSFGISSSGYRMGKFSGRGNSRQFSIHVETAKHFVENPDGKPWVNHDNGDKLDNYYGNLKWATPGENNKHAYDTGLKIGAWTGKTGKNHHLSKPIIQMDLTGRFIKEWENQTIAAKSVGVSQGSLNTALLGFSKSRTCVGCLWNYKTISNG